MISDGLAAVDPSSDWNAPTELWDNFEEPKIDAPVLKETPISKPLGVWKIPNLKSYPPILGFNKQDCLDDSRNPTMTMIRPILPEVANPREERKRRDQKRKVQPVRYELHLRE